MILSEIRFVSHFVLNSGNFYRNKDRFTFQIELLKSNLNVKNNKDIKYEGTLLIFYYFSFCLFFVFVFTTSEEETGYSCYKY